MTLSPDRVASRPLRRSAAALALTMAVVLTGCTSGMPTNQTLENLHQPVVEHTRFSFDLATNPATGLDPAQEQRLADWFTAIGLKYGDHVALDDPADATSTRLVVESVARKFGLLLDPVAPVTEGAIAGGQARVVVLRAMASVPGCPDWSGKSDGNLRNATSRNYGCAVSSNLAAMVADKQDLVHGQDDTGTTVAMTNAKAIDAYRGKAPSGGGGTAKGQSTQ